MVCFVATWLFLRCNCLYVGLVVCVLVCCFNLLRIVFDCVAICMVVWVLFTCGFMMHFNSVVVTSFFWCCFYFCRFVSFDLICGYVAVYLLWTLVALFDWLLVGLVGLVGFPLCI